MAFASYLTIELSRKGNNTLSGQYTYMIREKSS